MGVEIGDRLLGPDVAFIGPERVGELDDDGFHVPPDLVAEVTSPATRSLDLAEKREAYAFPLRFRRGSLRAFVKELAARESVSQNEFIEQAVEHEVLARGALLAGDLARAAQQLERATQAEHDELIARSLEALEVNTSTTRCARSR